MKTAELAPLAPTIDDRLIWDTWLALYRLPILTVAIEVGTFAALAVTSLTTEEVAARLSVDARSLSIHLGLLAALGFVERRGGRWRATPASRTWLLPDAPGYCGPILETLKQSHPLHQQLLATLRKEVVAEAHVSAAEEWERGEMPSELARIITAYMNAHGQAAAKAVALQPVIGTLPSLLDVAGGSAIFSIEIAKLHPRVQMTVMDIGVVCSEADRYIAQAGVSSSVRTQAVNMFEEAWPAGYSAHFLSNIFHDWSESTCELLARKSFAALPSGGTILLHEMLMDDDGCGPLATAAFSVLMLLGTRGRQYSLPELQQILEAAGFKDVETWRTASPYYSLVSARKP